MKTPLAGGVAKLVAPTSDLNSGPPYCSIAVTPTNVFWTEAIAGNVKSAPIGGGAATTLASVGKNNVLPTTIAVQDTTVYWADQEGRKIMSVPTMGGATTTLATGIDYYQVVAFWQFALGLAVAPQGLYTAAFFNGTILGIPLAGGTPQELASGNEPGPLAIDGTNAYWVDMGTGLLMQAPLAGGPATQLASQPGAPFTSACVAVDSASVYWSFPNPDNTTTIEKVPIGGGTAAVVGVSRNSVNQLAVDATSVYWLDDFGIWKLAK